MKKIGNYHIINSTFPGKLFFFEGVDGAGKSTAIKALAKELRKQGAQVLVSSWKSGKYFDEFFSYVDSPDPLVTLHPKTSLLIQAADFTYRLEREIIPALVAWKCVLCDRWIATILVRAELLGLSSTDAKKLIWFAHTIYKKLFDQAHTFYFEIDATTSIKRVFLRNAKAQNKNEEGTLLDLHLIKSLPYTPNGEKMNHKNLASYALQWQNKAVALYQSIFHPKSQKTIVINATANKSEIFVELLKNITK